MTEDYQPPKVWKWEKGEGQFAGINRPTSGAQFEKKLPVGKHALQLHSLATPNGVKVTVMLEELIELGKEDAEYDAYPVNILEGEQFSSGFVDINPNSKIPALLDTANGENVRVFESGSILLYLADKFDSFIPKDPAGRAETLNWLFWQMGSGPYLGGGFGHFYAYAPSKMKYPIDRFALETKRQLDVLDKRLGDNEFLVGSEYTIADIAVWPWYGALVLGRLYDAAEFLDVASYKNVIRWAEAIDKRPGVARGVLVNKTWGEDHEQMPERHGPEDFK